METLIFGEQDGKLVIVDWKRSAGKQRHKKQLRLQGASRAKLPPRRKANFRLAVHRRKDAPRFPRRPLGAGDRPELEGEEGRGSWVPCVGGCVRAWFYLEQ